MRELAAKYAAELESWDRIDPKEGMKDLLYSRRPKHVRKNEHGHVVELGLQNDEMAVDNTVLELVTGKESEPGSRRALDKIDELLEEEIGGEHGATRILEFLATACDEPDSSSANFFRAARARAALALRDLKLGDQALDQVAGLLKLDSDALTRSACAAVLANSNRAANLEEWVATERDGRALSGALVDWSRHVTREVTSADGQTVSANLGLQENVTGLIKSIQSRSDIGTEVRAAAVRALGFHIHEQGVFADVERVALTEPDEQVRGAAVVALGNAITNVRADRLARELAFGTTATDQIRHCAFVALSRSPRPEVAEAAAAIVLDKSSKARYSAAYALFGKSRLLRPETFNALNSIYETETDPAVRSLLGATLGRD